MQITHQGSPLYGLDLINSDNFPKIGNYEFLSVLGRGGMGVVCKYRNSTLNKLAAVKMISAKDLSEAAMVRFQREGQAAAKLQHPGIVAVHDLGVTEYGDPFMIMDYYDGETLEQLLNRKYQFSLAQLETIFLQCADAMQHAHTQGVLHRDLKPSNIMVTNLKSDKLVIKILDFGIAKILDENGEFTTTVGLNAGSPLFMSPEQSQGSPLDARADIYSLGCVFYAALVGEPPFKGKNSLETALQHQKEKPLPISQIPHLKSCPANISNTIMQMLEKDPWKRPQSMKEVTNLLQQKQEKTGGNKQKKNIVIWVAVGVTLLILAIVAVMLTISGSSSHIQGSSSNQKPDELAARIKELAKKYPDYDPTTSRLFSMVKDHPKNIDYTDKRVLDSDCIALLLDPELEELNLNHNDLTDAGAQIISQLPALRKLSLEYNTQLSDDGLKYISSSKTITTLHLKHTKIDDKGMPYIARMTQLKDLHLDETEITDHGIALLRNLKNLSDLTLSNNSISDKTLDIASKAWTDLKHLDVGGGIITVKGLNKLKTMPQLENLSLAHCANIGPRELKSIIQLKTLRTFETGEYCDDRDIEILCSLPTWTELRIDGTCTDRMLDILATEKNLCKLKFNGEIQASPSAQKKFVQALPQCRVSRGKPEYMMDVLDKKKVTQKLLTSP
jgi:serine/threonine protein kinase